MHFSSIWGQLKSYLRWIGPLRMTGSGVTGSDVSHMTGSDVSLSGSVLCACATASCAISALVGPFDRKRPCPEVALTGSRFCAFFLSNSNMATEGHLTPFGVPLGVRMRNRKLRNIRSDRRSHGYRM